MQDGLTAMPANTILYLHMIESDSCQHAKLAGIRRYAAARGWQAEAYGRFRSRARMVPGILARERPIGCIVEGAGRWDDLPPSLFGRTPVVYVDVLDFRRELTISPDGVLQFQ